MSVEENKIVMIDDTIDTLDYIHQNSKFATLHTSSFFI